jgi:hypothetical protein
MNKKISFLLLFTLGLLTYSGVGFSQDTISVVSKGKDKRPIRPPFDSGFLIDQQSVVIPSANTLDFMIQHRFGTMKSTTFDLAGLYAPSNIRIGLRYSLTDYLQLGIGSTKTNKLQDFNWKLRILQQTRSGTIPVSITYFGNLDFSLKEERSFGEEYVFAHRMSYFHQLIVSRKISRSLSVQVSGQFAHFNQIDTISYNGLKHNNLGFSINGKYKITPTFGVIFAYGLPLTTPDQIKPNASLGIEIGTTLHSFQIFLGSYSKISPQGNLIYNTNDFTNMDLLLGFNINRLWKF